MGAGAGERRRLARAWSAEAGPADLRERRGLGFSREEAAWLMGRLQRSDVSRFLSYQIIGEGDGGYSLYLNGWVGELYVSLDALSCEVYCLGECVHLADEDYRVGISCDTAWEEVVYAGPISGRTHEEILGLVFEVVRVFAGATDAFHEEARPAWKWRESDFGDFGDCIYDVYVRNGHTGPYLLSLDNITLHVNRDAEPADWEGFGSFPAPAAGAGG